MRLTSALMAGDGWCGCRGSLALPSRAGPHKEFILRAPQLLSYIAISPGWRLLSCAFSVGQYSPEVGGLVLGTEEKGTLFIYKTLIIYSTQTDTQCICGITVSWRGVMIKKKMFKNMFLRCDYYKRLRNTFLDSCSVSLSPDQTLLSAKNLKHIPSYK